MAKAQPIAGLELDQPILANAALIIETRLGEMLNYEPYIDKPDKVYELHQMRIAAKRLRYTMEIFQPLYEEFTSRGKEFGKATDEIKQIQEHLGEIHDADVLAPELAAHLSRLLKPAHSPDKQGNPPTGVHLVDFDGCQGLLTLCRNVRDERDQHYATFLDNWGRLREAKFFETLLSLIHQAAKEAPTQDSKRAKKPVSLEART